jgi:predicted MFS family arabinose efflux permease
MGIGRFSFTPLLPLMAQDGLIDIAGGGWVAAANYAGYLVGALSAPRLKQPPARLALAALLLTALLTAAMAWPSQLWLWALLRFVAGAASAWAFVGTSVWCLGALARHPTSPWSSAIYAGVGIGIALAGLTCLAGAAAGASSANLWLQLGIVAALLTLPVFAVLRRLESATPAERPGLRAEESGAGTRDVAGLMVCYGLFGFGYILPATFLPAMARALVDDPRLFGLAWPLFGLMAAASTLMAGWWLRRASRLQVWAASHLLMGVGVLLPSLWLAGWTIALSAVLVGGTFVVVTLAGVQEIRSHAGADSTALVARMTTAFAVGQIAGPLATTLLLQVPALQAYGLDLALQLGAAALLGSALWLWRRDGRG